MIKKRFLKDRLVLSIMRYFNREPESIRQTQIVPGKYYYNFNVICKAVPLSYQEIMERQSIVNNVFLNNDLSLEAEEALVEHAKSGCDTCPFNETLPCPLNLSLPTGQKICHSHKFVVIKSLYD